jgi:hypothetical protein
MGSCDELCCMDRAKVKLSLFPASLRQRCLERNQKYCALASLCRVAAPRGCVDLRAVPSGYTNSGSAIDCGGSSGVPRPACG